MIFEVVKEISSLLFPVTQIIGFNNAVQIVIEGFFSLVAKSRGVIELFLWEIEQKLTDYLLIDLIFFLHMIYIMK